MKKRIKARGPALLAAAALFCAACGGVESSKVMLDILSPAVLNPDKTQALFLTNFWLTQEIKDIDLNKELRDYWTGELAVRFKGPISAHEVRFENEALFQDAAFWKQLGGGAAGTVILTGRVNFTQETRKALLEVDKGRVGEPFVREKTWDVRQHFTLECHFYLIAAETGLVTKDQVYKETTTYPNPNQPALFALYDLLRRVKAKFFRDAFGAPLLQERYLLSR